VRDVADALHPLARGQHSKPGGSPVLDAVELLGGGPTAHAHMHSVAASEGDLQRRGVVDVAVRVIEV